MRRIPVLRRAVAKSNVFLRRWGNFQWLLTPRLRENCQLGFVTFKLQATFEVKRTAAQQQKSVIVQNGGLNLQLVIETSRLNLSVYLKFPTKYSNEEDSHIFEVVGDIHPAWHGQWKEAQIWCPCLLKRQYQIAAAVRRVLKMALKFSKTHDSKHHFHQILIWCCIYKRHWNDQERPSKRDLNQAKRWKSVTSLWDSLILL